MDIDALRENEPDFNDIHESRKHAYKIAAKVDFRPLCFFMAMYDPELPDDGSQYNMTSVMYPATAASHSFKLGNYCMCMDRGRCGDWVHKYLRRWLQGTENSQLCDVGSHRAWNEERERIDYLVDYLTRLELHLSLDGITSVMVVQDVDPDIHRYILRVIGSECSAKYPALALSRAMCSAQEFTLEALRQEILDNDTSENQVESQPTLEFLLQF